ncbi:MAG: cytochrome c3 family protein [Coriobacteriales bacterium]|jgi:hypothetical protein|nr:cytochrome c3 family protein [Coriobacteriales bacterium]
MTTKKLRLLILALVVSVIVALVACAPRQAAEQAERPGQSTGAGQPTGADASESDSPDEQVALELPAWSSDSNCESCHVAELESGSDAQCTYSLHASESCVSCHSDDAGALATAHEDYASANQPTRLKTTEVSQDSCLSCHDSTELAVASVATTALTDNNGTVVNPHDLPATESHLDKIRCSSCHKMHKAEPAEETSRKACLGCHHVNVYECGTCHE